MDRIATSWPLCQEKGSFVRTNDCSKSSTTFATAWTVSSVTMVSVTLEITSQTGAPSMAYSVANLYTEMAWCRVFRRISILFIASWWLQTYLAALWRTHIGSTDSTSSYRSITWSDDMGAVWMHSSVISDWWQFEQWLLLFCSVKACDSTFYLSSSKRYTFQQDNEQPQITGIIWTFLDTEKSLTV